MALSVKGACENYQCRKAAKVTRPGWECRDGIVRLCNQCYIAYMRKQFCHIYHQNSDSWSTCKYCNKIIHLGCKVSQYTELNEGGIKCNGCAPPNALLLPSSQETPDETTGAPAPLACAQQTLVANNQMADDDYLPEAPRSTPPPMALDPNESNSSTKPRAQIEARNAPKMTDEEVNAIDKGLNEEVIPLFEKTLSASDTGKGGRLVLPIRCAEKFFPSVDDGKSKTIVVQDFKGKDWRFGLKVWHINNNKMYILDGFDDYVRLMELTEGDIVTFCKLVPEGKLVIGNRKGSSTSSCKAKRDMAGTSSCKQDPKGGKRNSNIVSIGGSSINKDKGKKPSCARRPNVGSKRKTPEICSTSKSAPELVETFDGNNVFCVIVQNGCQRSIEGDTISASTRQCTASVTKVPLFKFDLNTEPDSDAEPKD